jgi:predicted RNase H-like HicB family nuclease
MTANEYKYEARWSEEDEGFVATCPSFPSVSWISHDRGAALSGLRDLIEMVLRDMKRSGEPIPAP